MIAEPSNEVRDEVIAYLQKKIGCEAFVLIAMEQKVPCPDALSGEICEGHESGFMFHGLQCYGNLKDVLSDASDHVDKMCEIYGDSTVIKED